jgi:hypothetical protein
MSGKASRAKGARGQCACKRLLLDRDWSVDSITCGIAAADLIATDPSGKVWAVEVKNCSGILPTHKAQAIAQGRDRKLPWLLASKISGSSSWLIQRQSELPQVWHEKGVVRDPNSARENATVSGLEPSGGVKIRK